MPGSFKHSAAPTHAEQLTPSSVPALSSPAVCWRMGRLEAVGQLCLCSLTTVVLLAGVAVARAEPILAAPNSAVAPAERIAGFVAEASQRFAISTSLIRAVMRAESLDDARALSPKGAMGLMQIMPDTWSELRSRYGLGADPYDPHDNIVAGTAYLRELHDRYGERGFLVAYNAGPSRYEHHLATSRPLPAETLSYMATVASLLGGRVDGEGDIAAAVASSWTSASLFVPHTAPGSVLSRPSSNALMPTRLAAGTEANRTALAPLSDGLFAKVSTRSGRP